MMEAYAEKHTGGKRYAGGIHAGKNNMERNGMMEAHAEKHKQTGE